MATKQLKSQCRHVPERSLSCPLLPRTLPVEIAYRGQVISSHYVKNIRDEICLLRHRKFLQHKYHWSDQSWDAIAWDSFHLCGSRTINLQASFRSKLVHNWLHLGKRRALQSVSSPQHIQTCPLCHDIEDFRHLLTCSSPRALRIRYDATKTLRKKLDTSPSTAAMFRAIKQWTQAPEDPVRGSPGAMIYSTSVETAIASQSLIGWDHLLRGFVSSDWGRVHSPTDSTPTNEQQQLAIPRLATIIRALQDYSLALWTGRNAILHEQSLHSASIVHSQLNHDITQMFTVSTSLSNHLRSYFSLPLEARLRQSPRQRQRWLRLVRLATSHSSSAGSRQQLISIYFPYMGEDIISPQLPCLAHAPSYTNNSTTAVSPSATVRLQSTIPSYFLRATVDSENICNGVHSTSLPLPTTPISPVVVFHNPTECSQVITSMTPHCQV